MTTAADPADAPTLLAGLWSPRVVARRNGDEAMVVKAPGEFVWRSHADTDDLFLALAGEIDIELRHGVVTPGAGERFVAPAGVEPRLRVERAGRRDATGAASRGAV